MGDRPGLMSSRTGLMSSRTTFCEQQGVRRQGAVPHCGQPAITLPHDTAFYSSLCSPSPAKRKARPLRENAWPAPNEPTRQDFITATKRELATTAREEDVWQKVVDLRLSKEDVIEEMERELAVMAESPVVA